VNDLDLLWRSFKVMLPIASHSPFNISQTVRDKELVAKDHQYRKLLMGNRMLMTDDVT